jgi:hypothetical protein
MSRDDELERIARIVVDCGYQLHSDLGPGLLESAYEGFLAASLTEKGVAVDNAFKIDLLVEDRLVVELKSVERNAPVHAKQLTTYLRLMGLPLGLLMNFGLPTFKAGIQRIANGYHSGWSNE